MTYMNKLGLAFLWASNWLLILGCFNFEWLGIVYSLFFGSVGIICLMKEIK